MHVCVGMLHIPQRRPFFDFTCLAVICKAESTRPMFTQNAHFLFLGRSQNETPLRGALAFGSHPGHEQTDRWTDVHAGAERPPLLLMVPMKNILSVRAVTRQETTAAVVDGDLYAEHLVRMNYSDSHSTVCREVRARSVGLRCYTELRARQLYTVFLRRCEAAARWRRGSNVRVCTSGGKALLYCSPRLFARTLAKTYLAPVAGRNDVFPPGHCRTCHPHTVLLGTAAKKKEAKK